MPSFESYSALYSKLDFEHNSLSPPDLKTIRPSMHYATLYMPQDAASYYRKILRRPSSRIRRKLRGISKTLFRCIPNFSILPLVYGSASIGHHGRNLYSNNASAPSFNIS